MTNSQSLIGASEAKTHFSELIERVARGEELTITRHGTPVARLIPVKAASSPQQRRVAIDRMRELAAELTLGGLRVKDLIIEGRR